MRPRAGDLPVTKHVLIMIEFVWQTIFQLLPASPWLNCAAAVGVRSTMSLGPKEASFPEVCNVCVCQVKTATCAEILEHFWRFLTLSSTTSAIFFQKYFFFSY